MAILQVRDVPDSLYKKLKSEAMRQKRSISQQALAILERSLLSADQAKARRKKLVSEIKSFWKKVPKNMPDVTQLIREDRDR
ncbi:MAG: hypothetical protein JWQ35_2071 [Bacteriovoracaceae bacterium]|nr:hypothetical protein [Bacteriovoracaceae bacterium]